MLGNSDPRCYGRFSKVCIDCERRLQIDRDGANSGNLLIVQLYPADNQCKFKIEAKNE